MRLVTYISGLNAARLGVLADGLVVDVERFGSSHGLALPNDMLSFIDNSVTLLPALKDLLGSAAMRLPAGSAAPLENVSGTRSPGMVVAGRRRGSQRRRRRHSAAPGR